MKNTLFISDDRLKRTIHQLKSILYLKFETSISKLAHNNSKLITILAYLTREFQILTILLDKKFLTYWGLINTPEIQKWKMLINPAFYLLTLQKETQNYIVSINAIIGSLEITRIILISFKKQEKQNSNLTNKNNGKWLARLIFFGYYYVSPILIMFHSGQFSCEIDQKIISENFEKNEKVQYYNSEIICSEFSSINALSLLLMGVIILRIYLGISANFNRRVAKSGFGAKRRNFGGRWAFIIQTFMVIGFNLTASFISAKTFSILFCFGYFLIFFLRLNSGDYICQTLKKIEISFSAAFFWISVALLTLIILEDNYGKSTNNVKQLVLLGYFVIIITSMFQYWRVGLKKLIFEKESKHLNRIEILLHLESNRTKYSRKKNIEIDYLKKIYMDEISSISEELTSLNQTKKEKFNFEEIFFQKILKDYLLLLNKNQDEDRAGLKISFAYFLHDFLDLGKEAFHEIKSVQMENETLSLENEIEIFRIKKRLSDDINSGKMKKFQKDKILKISNFKKIRILKAYLEKATSKFNIFWENLKDFRPKITKIKPSLLSAHLYSKKVESYWNKNQAIFHDNVNGLFLYGTFKEKVLNEKIEGEKMKKKARKIHLKLSKGEINIMNFDFSEDIGLTSIPLCLIEDKDSELRVKSCNKQFASLLSYLKLDLIGRKFKTIVNLISLSFFQRKILNMKKGFGFEERALLTFKNHNGYLRVFNSKISLLLGQRGEKLLVIQIEMKIKPWLEALLLVNSTGRIFGQNEGVVNIFGLDNLNLKKNKIWFLKQISEDFERIKFKVDHKGVRFPFKQPVSGRIVILNVTVMKTSDCPELFLVCFRNNQDLRNSVLSKTMKEKTKSKSKTFSKIFQDFDNSFYINQKETEKSFMFYIDHDLNINGCFFKESKKNSFQTEEMILNALSPVSKHRSRSTIVKPKIDYGEGIKTRRLVNGNIQDIDFMYIEENLEDMKFDEEEEKEMELTQKNIDKKFEILFKKKTFKTEIMDKETVLKNLKTLQRFNFLFLILSLILIFANFFSSRNAITNLEMYLKTNIYSPMRNQYSKMIFQRIFDISLANTNMMKHSDNFYTKNEFIQFNKKKFKEDIETMNFYSVNTMKLYEMTDAADEILEFYNKDLLDINFNGSIKKFSLLEYFELIKVTCSKIENVGVEKIDFKDENYKFFEKNFLDTIKVVAMQVVSFATQKKDEFLEGFLKMEKMIWYIFLSKTILGIFLFIFFYWKITKHEEKMIKFQCLVDEKVVISKIKKCDNFLKMIQIEAIMPRDFLGSTILNEFDYLAHMNTSEENKFNGKLFFSKKKKVSGSLASILNNFNFIILIFLLSSYLFFVQDQKFNEESAFELSVKGSRILYFRQTVNKQHMIFLKISTNLKNLAGNPKLASSYEMILTQIDQLTFNSLQSFVEISKYDKTYFEDYRKYLLLPKCGSEISDVDKEIEGKLRIKCNEIYEGILKEVKKKLK